MKGIVLAGGSGTRLYPITKGISKQLMPIFDKPMIYYPISVLMLAGIREILIISTPYDLPGFRRLLGDGSDYGVHFEYAEQPSPDGLAQAFIIGEQFIGDDCACLVLGRQHLPRSRLHSAAARGRLHAEHEGKATVFGYWVNDPERYGVAEFDKHGNCLSIEEKPCAAQVQLCRCGTLFLSQQRSEYSQEHQAQCPWRTGNHHRQPGIPRPEEPEGTDPAARLRLARHRHPRQPVRSQHLHRSHREASRPQGRLPRRDCLQERLDRCRRSAALPSPWQRTTTVSISSS